MNARKVKIEIYNAMRECNEQEAKDLLYIHWFYFGHTPTQDRKVKAVLKKICQEVEKTL